MSTTIFVTNIQRFSLHDGPGIRTTLFLKGCTLRCPWCSNPENINFTKEHYALDGKEGIYGREYTVDEVFIEIMKDKNFYDGDGGVTFSGGEPLLQSESILPLAKRIKEVGITTAVETCLFVPTDNLKTLIPYIDYFYVDMKIMDVLDCKDKIKGNLNTYHKNMKLLCSYKNVTVRIPVIGGYTDSDRNRRLVVQEIMKFKESILKIELIKEHNLGESKYLSLGLTPPIYIGVSDNTMEKYKEEIREVVDIPVEVCRV